MNGTYLSCIVIRKHTFVIPAQAGIQEMRPLLIRMDPGLRRDDGGFGLSKCHSCLVPNTRKHDGNDLQFLSSVAVASVLAGIKEYFAL